MHISILMMCLRQYKGQLQHLHHNFCVLDGGRVL